MLTWSYPAVFDRHDDGEIIVRFPDLPEVLTSGATEQEARTNAEDALEEAVLAYLADDRPVPAPREPRAGETAVDLPLLTAARAAVAAAMAAQHVNKMRLASLMHRDEKVVRRILDGKGNVKIDNVSAALRVLGVEARLVIEPAHR